MGLFSKKEFVCKKCGKKYFSRLNLSGNLCDECWTEQENEARAFERAFRGYEKYNMEVTLRKYSTEDKKQILEHREKLVEKLANKYGINRAELAEASNNYKELSDQEAENIITRAMHSEVSVTAGSVYGGHFFMPTRYEGVLVDAADVFAVGYTTDYTTASGLSEAILCAVFTNDPYVPVIQMIYTGKVGFFEMKSKKGREGLKDLFESLCPNLTYEVDDLKALKKVIKKDGEVKGNFDAKSMLGEIERVLASANGFNSKPITNELLPGTIEILDKMGYISRTEINKILKMDKMANGSYWNMQIEKLHQ